VCVRGGGGTLRGRYGRICREVLEGMGSMGHDTT
jgi:hypothetical protein